MGGIWTPHDPAILNEIRQRVRDVLFWRPGQPLIREYGPSFACEKCRGEKLVLCGTCKGRGTTPKTLKACGPCGGAKMVTCPKCSGVGQLDEAPLPWRCSYCSVKDAACLGGPLAATGIEDAFRLEVSEGKAPKWLVKRAAWEKAGLSFVTPASQRKPEAG